MKKECQDCGALVETRPLMINIGNIACGRMELCKTCIRRRYQAVGKEAPDEEGTVDSQ